MEYEASRVSTMDKVFMARELYCAVDHLEEAMHFSDTPSDREVMSSRIKQMTELRRDVVGSMNGNKDYACLFKHMSGAWKAAEEVWLADNDSESYLRYMEMTELFYWTAQRFLGKKLKKCERCGKESKPSTGDLVSVAGMKSTIGTPNNKEEENNGIHN